MVVAPERSTVATTGEALAAIGADLAVESMKPGTRISVCLPTQGE